MNLWLILGFGTAAIGGLGFLSIRWYRAGRDAYRADDAEQAMKDMNDAIRARDDSRIDAERRERLRQRYRNGG